jgi:hypothetical protein
MSDDQPLAVLSPDRVRVRCGACDVWFDSVFELQEHFQSDAHKDLAVQVLAATDDIATELAGVLRDLRTAQAIYAAVSGRLVSIINQVREDRHVAIAPNPSGQ